MPSAPRSGISVGRLRIRARHDPLTARLALERLLNTASIRPVALPPAAIVVVRSLRDPLPGSLDLETRALHPPRAWERAVADALEGRIRQAARPAAGAVPADAEAVVFADRAELLACLAADWCSGTVSTSWWWRVLLPRPSPSAVVDAWSDEPQSTPAAFERLARGGQAVAFAARIPVPAALTLARSVVRVFALDLSVDEPSDGPQLAAPVPHVAAPAEAVGASPTIAAESPPHAVARPEPEPPPWRSVAPETAGPLEPEQELLLGVALVLARQPGVARTPRFTAEASEWLRGRRQPPPPGVDDTPVASLPVVAEPVAAPVRSEPELQRARPMDHRFDVARPAPRRPRRREHRDLTTRRAATHGSPPDAAPPPAVPHAAGGIARRGRQTPSLSSRPADETFHETRTALGGVFHLLNLAIYLGLYGDFTTPKGPGIKLSPWDFLPLVAPGLLGRRPRDDVWELLRELAGRRSGDAPGRGFRAPVSWRVPRAWLDAFDDDRHWRWTATSDRVRVAHPAGFLVLDVPRRGVLEEWLERELRRYGSPAITHRAVAAPRAASPLARWVSWLSAYARARLALALAVSPREAPALLLRRPARVLVTDTRVDVVSALADLPLAVRLAGLDRDLGWVPAAGRYVAYQFE